MYNDNGIVDLFNESVIDSDFISVDNLVINNTLTLTGVVITGFPVDNTSIDFNGLLQLEVKNGGITTSKLANLSYINFQQGSNKITEITNANPTVNTIITIPNPGFNSTNFITQDFESNVAGTSTPQLINSDLQLLGSTTYIQDQQINLPVNSIMYTGSSNTGVANKPIVTGVALINGQLLIGSTSAAPVAANITGTSNQITVTNGAGTITLSLPQNISITSSPTFESISLTNTTNQIFLGNQSANYTTITSIAPSASQIITIPDSGAVNSAFVLTEGTQTIQANNTWQGTNNFQFTVKFTNPPISSAIYLNSTGVLSGVQLTNGQLLIGYTGNSPVPGSITGTSNEVIVTNSPGNITLSLPQAIATSSTPTFASETLTATSNQLTLGTTNTTTISSTAPSASRTYTIVDAGSNSNFIMGNSGSSAIQTIIGTNSSVYNGVLTVTNNTASQTVFSVIGDNTSTSPNQLNITGQTNTNFQLQLGYNTSLHYGSLQAGIIGTGTEPICLNPSGGGVSINKNTNTAALDVAGSIKTDTGIYLPTAGGTADNLNYCEYYTNTVTGTNPGGVSLTFEMQRVGRNVTISWTSYLQNLNGAVITFLSTIPARLCPAANKYFQIAGNNNNGNVTNIQMIILSTGDVWIEFDYGPFTAAYGGIYGGCVTWIVGV